MNIFRGLLGIFILLGICFLLSRDRKSINWRLVLWGMGLQIVLAILMIKIEPIRHMFSYVVEFFLAIIRSSEESAVFMFGNLAKADQPYGFAFYVLPILVVFSALSSLLYYYGILQRIVYGFAWVMKKTIRISGAESLAAAANIFIGQTEAPLIVKPYLAKMTRSEIMCIMTGGFATIAGSVFAAYLGLLQDAAKSFNVDFGLHLLTASIISAPAAIVAAKMLIPEDKGEETDKTLKVPRLDAGSNVLDAIAKGTTDGTKLAVNVGAMLLAFTGLIYLFNYLLGSVGEVTNLNEMIAASSQFDKLSLEYIFGLLFAPVAWIIGIPTQDIFLVGQLLGEKVALNEFFAYISLSEMVNEGQLSSRSIILATYALCGFANFASIGIQIGGIGSLAPNQRKTLTELGLLALVGGTVAAFLTAAIAGILI